MYIVNYKINIYFLRFIIWYRTRIMYVQKRGFETRSVFFLLFCNIILYIILYYYYIPLRNVENRFPLRRRWFVLPTNDHRRHRCVCASAPRARSTWDRSVAVAAVAVNLVKFPVARRRRRCRSAVHTTPPLPPPFTNTATAPPPPPPPPTRDSKRYRPPLATIKMATKNYRHRSPSEYRVRLFILTTAFEADTTELMPTIFFPDFMTLIP